MGEGLTARGVGYRYGSHPVLREISMSLPERGVTGLVGVNGAGKTTLLRILAGGLRPTPGTVTLDDEDLYRRSSRRQALPRIAYMPQHVTFPAGMTAIDTVRYLTWMRGRPLRQSLDLARAALEQVGLSEQAVRRIGALSGGMQRRVALAQAISCRPEVLLLDEPSTGLDPQQRARMVEIVKGLPGAVLLSSHVMEDIVDVADRVLILHAGELVFQDTVAALLALAPVDHRRPAEAAFLRAIGAKDTGG